MHYLKPPEINFDNLLNKKILVIGGNSTIGRNLSKSLSEFDINFYATYHNSSNDYCSSRNSLCLDLYDSSFPQEIHDQKFTHAIICAGKTNIQWCEEHKAESYKINVLGINTIASALSSQGVKVLFLSSSTVFHEQAVNNHEYGNREPNNQYGIQKQLVENNLLTLKNSYILRISKVFDKSNKLLQNWKNALVSGEDIKAFQDLNIAPLSIQTLVDTIIYLIEKDFHAKIMHVSSSEQISYYKLAIELSKHLGIDSCKHVKNILTTEKPDILYKPVKANLECRLRTSFCYSIRNELKMCFNSLA